MLKKLRKKFISIAMISVSVVLIAIVGAINIANYISTNNMLDARLELIAGNGGTFPDFQDDSAKNDNSYDKLNSNNDDNAVTSDSDAETESSTVTADSDAETESSIATPDSDAETESSTATSDSDAKTESSIDSGQVDTPEKATINKDNVNTDAGISDEGSANESKDTRPEPPKDMPNDLLRNGITEESQFDTRYFTVTIGADGEVESIDTGKIASVSSSTASEYAKKLWNDGKNTSGLSGFVGYYKYMTIDNDGSVMYIFLNAQRELSTVKTYIIASAGISVLGLIVVFMMIYFLSGKVLKPVSESYEKQKRFITDASHEIKTPLTIIDANTEVLEMMEGENEWTASTRKQIARLTSLTEKLVFLSRMEEEETKLVMSEFSLTDAVLDVAEPFTAVAESKAKHLDIEVSENMSYNGDEKTIRQLVSLLLDNAMKYSSKEGQIKITAHESGKNKVITVWNTLDPSSGIEKGRLDYLFERFYRTDKSRNSKTGGFGIGLSVAYAIVEAHKGKITAKSEDGSSIVFTVVLSS